MRADTSTALQALSRHPQWLALLHFGRTSGPDGSYHRRSFVDDDAFFLSADGHRDPLAELEATVDQLARDASLRCRFVARYQWLQSLDLLNADDLSHCEAYRQWRLQINAGSIALVFAASYLNSPSSMYGHTFLRVNPRGPRSDSAFLAHAINYAAVVPPRDNSLLFAWRGMTGGYQGLFSLQPYVEKLQEYSRLENRDIWEYELNLTDAELDRLMAHAWELRDINFDYYFMDENCSFRLLELLEVARPSLKLTSKFRLHAIPVDTVRAVREAGAVGEVVYRPSRQRELSELLETLSESEQTLVLALAEDVAYAEREDFSALEADVRYRVALAAYRLLRYRHNREARDPDIAGRSFALLRLINQLAEDGGVVPPVSRPLRPDRGHGTGQWGLAGGELDDRGYGELELRLTYHDLLDPVGGYPEGASLNMLRAVFRKAESRAPRLQTLDVLDIRSLAPRDRFFRPVSWQVRAGAERQDFDSEFLAPFATAGAGGSWPVLGATLSLLASARLEYNEDFADNWQVAPGAAARLGWQGPRWAAGLEAQHHRFGNGVDRDELMFQVQTALGDNQGVRLNWSRQLQDSRAGDEVSLQWRRYF